ncbi:acyltransferase family protein [Asaia krungthepensis]|uniref:Lipopolysaccharide modification acyltransferase n=1 Tax=Asaia krungthepensis NRIC 0535 TaxID=1307925 RepID=A0ABQ0PYP6_9PROT|nr:acyltransferase [Asaia krungthepensis]GBQ84902.1 lipopolysaccharide modification acyltransferase [Asaia krungthepensis NRIC 0535]
MNASIDHDGAFPARYAGRNAGIDCLRGLSILLVVIHHLALRFPLTETGLVHILPLRVLRMLNWGGIKGVTIFFVISGFLITRHMLERSVRPAALSLRDFTGRRIARLLPCLLALIVVACMLGLLGVPSFVPDHPGQTLWGAALSALTMHLNVYEAETGYLPAYWDVLWSLSVEELFYLGFPLICVTLGRTPRRLLVCAALLALAAPWFDWSLRNASEIWQDKAYGPGMSAIATGIVAALLLPRVPAYPELDKEKAQRGLSMLCGSLGCAGIVLYLLWGAQIWSILSWVTPLFFNTAIALTLWALARGWGAHVTPRRTAWLRQWGQRSYELYLSHMFVLMPIIAFAHAAAISTRWAWVLYPPTLLLVFWLGSAIERLYSRPLDLYLRRRLIAPRCGAGPQAEFAHPNADAIAPRSVRSACD